MRERFQTVRTWLQDRGAAWGAFRIALGIVLFYQGVYFMRNPSQVANWLEVLPSEALRDYVTYGELIGGLFLIVGCLTRVAALAQLPIFAYLAGLTLISAHSEPMATLLYSLLPCVALILCVTFGAGRYSVDRVWRTALKHSTPVSASTAS
jgi:putative oxidoreductase